MSTTEQTAELSADQTIEHLDEHGLEPVATIELTLSEGEALRAWLLKPAHDGSTSLDDPLVSRALTKIGMAVDTVRTTVNVRRELEDAGLPVAHMSDEQVRDLGLRLAQVATAAVRP